MPPSIGWFRASAPSHHDLCSAAFITNIAEFGFRHTHPRVRLTMPGSAGYGVTGSCRSCKDWFRGLFGGHHEKACDHDGTGRMLCTARYRLSAISYVDIAGGGTERYRSGEEKVETL
jgi:hypothetical protein